MLFVAHRGFRIGNVDENTFQAFKTSIYNDMDYIELDVQLSADNYLFILHDDDLKRTMNIQGLLADKTLEELNNVTSINFNQPIPLLSETIKEFLIKSEIGGKKPKIKLMIELKGPNTAQPTCEIIKKYKVHEYVCFSGRYLDRLRKAHDTIPEVPICLNITKCKSFTIEDLLKTANFEDLPLPFSMISLKSNFIKNDNFIKKCKKLGIKALSWNFIDFDHSLKRIKELISQGIDGILFDDPKTVEPIRKFLKIKEVQ